MLRCWLFAFFALSLFLGLPAVEAGSTLDRVWLATLKKNDLDAKDRNFAPFTEHLVTFQKCFTSFKMVLKGRRATLTQMEGVHAKGVKAAKDMIKGLNPNKHKATVDNIQSFIDTVTSEGGIGKMGNPEVAMTARRADTAKQWKEVLKSKMPNAVKKQGKAALKIWDKFDGISKKYDELAGEMVGYRTCMGKESILMEKDLKLLKRWSGPDKKTTDAVATGSTTSSASFEKKALSDPMTPGLIWRGEAARQLRLFSFCPDTNNAARSAEREPIDTADA